MNCKEWRVGDEGGFAAIGQIIIVKWASRLGELEYVLRTWNDISLDSENATTTVIRTRSVLYTPISFYIDFTHYSNTSSSWLAPAEARCKTAYTKHVETTTEVSALVKSSIEGVLVCLCETAFRLVAEAVPQAPSFGRQLGGRRCGRVGEEGGRSAPSLGRRDSRFAEVVRMDFLGSL